MASITWGGSIYCTDNVKIMGSMVYVEDNKVRNVVKKEKQNLVEKRKIIVKKIVKC